MSVVINDHGNVIWDGVKKSDICTSWIVDRGRAFGAEAAPSSFRNH